MTAGRIIPFRNAANFRDLGGYPTQDGRRVRSGLLYRGASLERLEYSEDWDLLLSLGLKAVLDFRSSMESEASPDPAIPGAVSLRCCAMHYPDGAELDFSPAGIQRLKGERDRFAQKYGSEVGDKQFWQLLNGGMPFNNKAYQILFQLLENGDVPVLFHCTAGKDRTGIAAILVLMALNVSRELALDDYDMTNICYHELVQREPIAGVQRATAVHVLDTILNRYHSMENYFFAEFGLDSQRLDKLRLRFLEPAEL